MNFVSLLFLPDLLFSCAADVRLKINLNFLKKGKRKQNSAKVFQFKTFPFFFVLCDYENEKFPEIINEEFA